MRNRRHGFRLQLTIILDFVEGTMKTPAVGFNSIPFFSVGFALFFAVGCAPMGHVATTSGKPEVVVHGANWKTASVAIAEYNLSKGRKLDNVRPNQLVMYEAVASTDGTEEITSKTIYTFYTVGDSLLIDSHRYLTDDIDDSDISEANDQATYDMEQQELSAIAANIEARNAADVAEPTREQ